MTPHWFVLKLSHTAANFKRQLAPEDSVFTLGGIKETSLETEGRIRSAKRILSKTVVYYIFILSDASSHTVSKDVYLLG